MKKKWIFITIGSILLIIIGIFVISYFRRPIVDNELLKSKKEMINKLNNFSYDSLININMYGASTDINLDCKEDRSNKIGYCSVTSNFVNLEEYLDYNNKVTYTKTDIISSYNDSTTWKKSKEKDMIEVPMLKMVDGITVQKKEEKENGMLYIGVINGKTLSQTIKAAGTPSKFNLSRLIRKKIPVEVFVNNDNYIEYINSDVSILGIEIKMDIKYHDFNTTPSLSLPKEINEL